MAIATGAADAFRQSGGDRLGRCRLLCMQARDGRMEGRDDSEADRDALWRIADSSRTGTRRTEKDRGVIASPQPTLFGSSVIGGQESRREGETLKCVVESREKPMQKKRCKYSRPLPTFGTPCC